MDILPHYDLSQLLQYVPDIKKNNAAWRMIEVSLDEETSHNIVFIAKRLETHFKNIKGVVFICNSKEILVLANVGEKTSNEAVSKGIQERMPEKSCSCLVSEATADGLLRIQIRLEDMGVNNNQKEVSQLLKTKMQRGSNVVMVIDDDAFMRSLVSKTFIKDARVIEVDERMDIVEAYLESLPDVMFLDIHLHTTSGMDILGEIVAFDDSAYIIMISSDTVPENVLNTKRSGAKGFVAKPFTKERLITAYNKCPTITAPIMV